MKTVILCAGFATRLGDLTKDKPKCLLDIDGFSILDRLIFNLEETDDLYNKKDPSGHKIEERFISEVYVLSNALHFPKMIDFGNQRHEFRVPTHFIHNGTISPDLSRGPVRDLGDLMKRYPQLLEEDLMIMAGDLLTDYHFGNMVELFRENGDSMILVDGSISDNEEKKRYGCVMLDDHGNIYDFVEKPDDAYHEHKVAQAIYIIRKDQLKVILDICNDIDAGKIRGDNLGNLVDHLLDYVGEIFKPAYLQEGNHIIDIGTPEDYKRAVKFYQEMEDEDDGSES